MLNPSKFDRRWVRLSQQSLALVLLLCAAIFVSATQALAANYNRAGAWWTRVPDPLFGMAYTAEPSDYNNSAPMGSPERTSCPFPDACKYFDSDFTNADFSLLWGPSGRNDLGTIRGLGMNFIALYDWAGGFCRDHKPFLDAAWNGGKNPLMVTIPISDTKVQNAFEPSGKADILSILYQAYGLDPNGNGTPNISPAASMWRIGNEVALHHIELNRVVQVVKIILNFEAEKGIPDNQKLVFTSDVDFGVQRGQPPGIAQMLDLQKAFNDAGLSDIWHTRFIASINTKNEAPLIQNYVTNVFPNQSDFSQGSGLPLFFAEYGLNSKEACEYIRDTTHQRLDCNSIADQNKAQAEYEKAEFETGAALAKNPPTSSFFYGFSVFQWQDAFWKCPHEYVKGKTGCTESLFGIQTVGKQTATGNIAGGPCGLQPTTYPVNALDPKPIFSEIPGALNATTEPAPGGTLKGKHTGFFDNHGR